MIMAMESKDLINNTKALLCLLLLTASFITPSAFATQEPDTDNTQDSNTGLPIFRFNDNHWFELGMPQKKRPTTEFEIQDQKNRENAEERAEREGKDGLFSDDLEPLNEIQLRYRIKF